MQETETNLNETVSRILGLIIRRRWWILLTACATAMATLGVLFFLPNHYTSEARLLVVQQQVPERYVVSNTSTGLAEALQAMQQEVLSRTRLLGIVDEFQLYSKEKQRVATEQIYDLMRHNIEIKPLDSVPEAKDFNAFKISFTAGNPHLAQEVTSRLTSLFIEENLKTREEQAQNTTKFLEDHLETVAKQLSAQEERLRDFKMQHLGDLPEQQSGNLAILSGLQNQLQSTMAGLSRAQQQKGYLESLLNGYKGLQARGVSVPGVAKETRTVSPLEAAQNELARLQKEKDALLDRYTPEHPDVATVLREIAKQQKVVDGLKAAKKPTEDTPQTPAAVTSKMEDDSTMAQLRSQLEANRLETASLSKDEKRLKASIDEYQGRLNSTPIREQEMAQVLRDYELLKKQYADLLDKQQQSQMATSLEKQQEGQQFRLIDAASLPTLPSSPKRQKISLGGLAAGIILGFALAFLMDMKNPCFHTEKELSAQFAVPMVLGIPLVLTSGEERKRTWRIAAEWLAGSVLVLLVLSAELFVYKLG